MKSVLGHKAFRKQVNKAQVFQAIKNNQPENTVYTTSLRQSSNKKAAEFSTRRLKHMYAQVQTAEKTLMLYKTLNRRDSQLPVRNRDLTELNDIAIARGYTNNAHPTTGVTTQSRVSEKQTAVTVRRSLR